MSFFKKILGILCIIAGIFFGFIPLIPGFVLVFLGLELLGVPLIPWEKIKAYMNRKKKEEPRALDENKTDDEDMP